MYKVQAQQSSAGAWVQNFQFHLGQAKLTRSCLLYTSDAADEPARVDLGGLRLIKKQTYAHNNIGEFEDPYYV